MSIKRFNGDKEDEAGHYVLYDEHVVAIEAARLEAVDVVMRNAWPSVVGSKHKEDMDWLQSTRDHIINQLPKRS